MLKSEAVAIDTFGDLERQALDKPQVFAAELLAHPGFVAFLSSVFEVVDFLAFGHIELVIADNHLDLASHN